MKRTAIPAARTGKRDVDQFMEAVKANLDQITGQAANVQKLAPLDTTTATTAQLATQLNAILARLQGT